MTTPTIESPRHPVARLVAHLHQELDVAGSVPLWSLDQVETGTTLVALGSLIARLQGLELRVAEHAGEVAVEELDGATSTGSWIAHATRLTPSAAHSTVRLAGQAPDAVVEALTRGEVLLEQARVITRAIVDLPADLDPAVRDQATRHLLNEAAHHDARALRILGRRVLEVLDPAAAEAHEAAMLEREEREAAAAARFTMSRDGQGSVYGRFRIPEATGAKLEKYLNAFAAPKRHHDDPESVERPSAERRGQAFVEFIERYPGERLPDAGGLNATVVVTMTLDSLLGGLATASLDTGEKITAAQARQMACEAGIIPVVLDGKSQVLDLGRTARLATKAQRIALGLTQGGCSAEGCDWPPGMCHAHHDEPWSRGGPTDLKKLRLLCPRHHHRAHDPTYETKHLTNNKIAFVRRT